MTLAWISVPGRAEEYFLSVRTAAVALTDGFLIMYVYTHTIPPTWRISPHRRTYLGWRMPLTRLPARRRLVPLLLRRVSVRMSDGGARSAHSTDGDTHALVRSSMASLIRAPGIPRVHTHTHQTRLSPRSEVTVWHLDTHPLDRA